MDYITLAPIDLPIKRDERFDGGGFDISLSDLAAEDVSLAIQIYQRVKGIYDLWLYMREQPNFPLLTEQLRNLSGRDFVSLTHGLGATTYRLSDPPPHIRKATHDIRGGALTSLLGYAGLIDKLPEAVQEDYIRKAVFLARDHAKMMRNIIPDIDIPTRQADEGNKLHSISDFIDKWDGFVFELPQRKKVRIEAVSTYEGYITNRCLETSAVDRILYNYINNAARFAAANQVRLTVLPINDEMTRWVIENDLDETQKAWLANTLNEDLKSLFYGGYTRGGHGIGLSSCVDLVAASFGVDFDKAIEDSYVGASAVDDVYYAWFHWPSYLPKSEAEVECEC